MSLPYQAQYEIDQLEKLRNSIASIVTEPARFQDVTIRDFLRKLYPLLKKYNLEYVDISGSSEEIAEGVNFYSDEIGFVFQEEIAAVDPRTKHRLFVKKISEMTGYEYQKYLRLMA